MTTTTDRATAPSRPAAGLTIAETAEVTGLTPDTLRYYERDGLMLGRVARTSSGHRSYSPDDLRWIDMVTCLRATGMPIRDVRRYTDLVRADDGNWEERLDMLREHRTRVLAQLAEVQEHLGAIDRKIGIYVDKMETVAARA